jgi:hypothetical protein
VFQANQDNPDYGTQPIAESPKPGNRYFNHFPFLSIRFNCFPHCRIVSETPSRGLVSVYLKRRHSRSGGDVLCTT